MDTTSDQRPSSETLKTLLDNIPGMAYRCANDEDWTMEFASEGSKVLSGYSSIELERGKPKWSAVIHEDDRDRVWTQVQVALAENCAFEIQYRIVTRNGQTRWVWERGRCVKSTSGSIASIEGFITDITPLKQSELALAHSKAQLEAIVSTEIDAIITFDAQGHIESSNKAAEDIFGYSANEVPGVHLRMLIPELFRGEHDQNFRNYLKTSKVNIAGNGREVTARHKDGSSVKIHLSIKDIGLNGNRCFVGVIRDLSIQKAAEEALRSEHERLSATIEHAPLGIVTYRFGGPFVSANRVFCETTGYTADELKTMTVEGLTHPSDRVASAALAKEAQAGNIGRFSHRKRYLHKDGAVIDVMVVNSITHDAAGQPDLIIGQVEDLTPRLKAEVEARELRERLAHVDRLNTLGEMAAGIAHEINQPLTAISLFSQAGKRFLATGSPDRLPEIFDKLSQHAQRAGAVVERMQAMSRQRESTREVLNCNTILKEIVNLAEADARIRDIVIDVDIAESLPCVAIDKVQIQQVTLNLLRNGMEAMRTTSSEGRDTIVLSTRLLEDGDVEVAIIDPGCGVSEEVAKNLFVPFSTTKTSGMGMGLVISRAIVAAHGGKLNYYNNEFGGATFYFTLPPAKQGEQYAQ